MGALPSFILLKIGHRYHIDDMEITVMSKNIDVAMLNDNLRLFMYEMRVEFRFRKTLVYFVVPLQMKLWVVPDMIYVAYLALDIVY